MKYERVLSRFAVALLCGSLALVSGLAISAKYKAAPTEVAQLPRYCWAQYMDDVQGAQYSVPVSLCGWGMNHYCPGLVELIRAKKTFGGREKLKERLGYLATAKSSVVYTLRAMKDYPHCSIRADVEATDATIDIMQKSTESLLRTAPR